MEEILMQLAQLTPVIAVLIYFIRYFQGEITAKNLEIKELNQQLRDNSKEMIVAINKMNQVVTDLSDLIKEKLK